MKKALSLSLILLLCLFLCACGGENKETEITNTLTAREQLTDLEEKLFNNLIAITKESFHVPSAVRVLEVCDYEERTKYEDNNDPYNLSFGPDTIVVRLQGQNQLGGTLNHYYIICLKTAENKSELAGHMIVAADDYAEVMQYRATEGEYFELSDDYSPENDESDLFNIGRINKALKEYWEELGF